jgi:hypothetical protein
MKFYLYILAVKNDMCSNVGRGTCGKCTQVKFYMYCVQVCVPVQFYVNKISQFIVRVM